MSAEVTSNDQSQAVTDVLAERKRQIKSEGWSAEHDDDHVSRELARGGAAYVQHYYERQYLAAPGSSKLSKQQYQMDEAPDCWPWDPEWWKPKDPRRDLVRAAALIIAEIERLDRRGK